MMDSMSIELVPISFSDSSVLRHLMQLYLYDFSEFTESDVNHHGLFEYLFLDNYWTEPERYPFLIKVDEHTAGFVLVRKLTDDNGATVHAISEFFVLRKYRRKKVGKQAAFSAFDRFPGHWHVSEINENVSAQKFWRQIIGEYTHGRYKEIRTEADTVIVQLFNSLEKK